MEIVQSVQSDVHYTLECTCTLYPCILHHTHTWYNQLPYCTLHLYSVYFTKQMYYIVEHSKVQFPAPSTALTMTLLSIYEHSPTINHFRRAISISMKTSMTQKALDSLIKTSYLNCRSFIIIAPIQLAGVVSFLGMYKSWWFPPAMPNIKVQVASSPKMSPLVSQIRCPVPRIPYRFLWCHFYKVGFWKTN